MGGGASLSSSPRRIKWKYCLKPLSSDELHTHGNLHIYLSYCCKHGTLKILTIMAKKTDPVIKQIKSLVLEKLKLIWL